jgi:hypothetical protein
MEHRVSNETMKRKEVNRLVIPSAGLDKAEDCNFGCGRCGCCDLARSLLATN